MSNSNIGTVEDALTAILIHLDYTETDGRYTYPNGTAVTEPGWKYLGSGIHRYCYLAPSGLVYKVPATHTDKGCRSAQEAEAKAAEILSQEDAPEGFMVPEVNLIDVDGIPVVVMPDYGSEPCYLDYDEEITAERFFRNTDTHMGNMRRVGQALVMIDLGFFKPEKVYVGVGGCCSMGCGVAGCCCGC